MDFFSQKYSRNGRSGLNDDWERGQRLKSYKTKVFRDGRWWTLRFVHVVGQVTGRLLVRVKAENFGRGLPEAAFTLIRDKARYCCSVGCSSLTKGRRRITRRNVFYASFLPVLAKTRNELVAFVWRLRTTIIRQTICSVRVGYRRADLFPCGFVRLGIFRPYPVGRRPSSVFVLRWRSALCRAVRVYRRNKNTEFQRRASATEHKGVSRERSTLDCFYNNLRTLEFDRLN